MNIPDQAVIAAVAVATLNIVGTLVNAYWTIRLKNIQGNSELIKTLTIQNSAKDTVIHDQSDKITQQGKAIEEIHHKKNQYKLQYQQLLLEYKKLEGANTQLEKSAQTVASNQNTVL